MLGSLSVTAAAHASKTALFASQKLVNWATIQGKGTNTGKVYVWAPSLVDGTTTLAYTIGAAGDSLVLWASAQQRCSYNLNKIFITTDVDGEGVDVAVGD